jgi:hypothetical protein
MEARYRLISRGSVYARRNPDDDGYGNGVRGFDQPWREPGSYAAYGSTAAYGSAGGAAGWSRDWFGGWHRDDQPGWQGQRRSVGNR